MFYVSLFKLLIYILNCMLNKIIICIFWLKVYGISLLINDLEENIRFEWIVILFGIGVRCFKCFKWK